MTNSMTALLDVMRKLREPQTGCPWDVKQDHKTLAKYLLEESYEVVEAIEAGDNTHLCEELGDVLLQVVFHAQIAAENGTFSFDDVAQGVADKMVERHPHVFGNRENVRTADDVLKNWEADKAEKRNSSSVLDDVNTALPAASRALKLQKRAARVGFDWENPADIVAKIREELDELEAEIQKGDTAADAMEDELGDVFFVLVNLARRLHVDPESALRRTNRKFETRFRGIETALASQNRKITDVCLAEMEELWNEMKAREIHQSV